MSSGSARRTLSVVHSMAGTPLVAVREDVWHPPTDVYETDTEIIVKVDVAGVEEGNMEVTVEDGLLRVSGYRSDCSNFTKLAVHRMEIPCGEFETHVHLPHAINTRAEISCVYRNGMLTIVLPKETAHKVPVQVS